MSLQKICLILLRVVESLIMKKICMVKRIACLMTFSESDVEKALKDIYISNVSKLIFGHLNINSLRKKFDLLSEQVKGSIDILILTKLDDSFPEGQSLIEGFHSPFRFDRKRNGGGITLYVQEDIPAKLLSHDYPCAESFFVKIKFIKRNGL